MDSIDETSFIGSISMFGDSLTEWSFYVPEGPGDRLSELCSRKDPTEQEVHVLNFGRAGQTTNSLKGFFKETVIDGYNARLPNAPPILITIWLGANDAVLPPSSAHVPIDTFEANIKEYVEAIRRQPGWDSTKILLISPPPINIRGDEDLDSFELSPETQRAIQEIRKNSRIGTFHQTWQSKRSYAKCVVSIAQEYKDKGVKNVDVLDVWTILTDEALKMRGEEWIEDKLPGCGLPGARGFPEGWFTDGVHFGSKGYKVVTDALIEKFNETDELARVLQGK